MPSDDYRSKCYAKESSLAAQNAVDELILAPSEIGDESLSQAYVLNAVAGSIWNLIDGQRNVMDIRDIIVTQFEVDAKIAEHDLIAFLEQLEQLGDIWPV